MWVNITHSSKRVENPELSWARYFHRGVVARQNGNIESVNWLLTRFQLEILIWRWRIYTSGPNGPVNVVVPDHAQSSAVRLPGLFR
jgi:hypothetical protein